MKDLYKVLGVSETASEAELKKVYRKLAKEYHPDATGGHKGKTERFKEINEAYAILGDAQKRAEYDRLRRAPVGSDGMPVGFDIHNFEEVFGDLGRGGSPAGGYRVSTFGGGNLGDLFASLFGGGGPGRGSPFGAGNAPVRGADMQGRLEISFAESVLGGTRQVRTGDGQTIEVQVPAGVESGGRLRVPGKGGRAAGARARAGDLFLDVAVSPHPHLRRVEDDIHLDVPISLKEALLGGRAEVPTVEGPVTVTIPPGTSSGQKLRLRGKGVKRPDGSRGDQICRIDVVVPKLEKLDATRADEARRLLEQLTNVLGDTPVRKFQA